MPFPTFDYCVICEMIRPELGGKFILLGFHGLAPNVDLIVPDINRVVILSMLAECPPVPEANPDYQWVLVVTRPDGVGIFETPPHRVVTSQERRLKFPLSFNIAPPILSGRYSIRIKVNGEVKLDTSFLLRAASVSEVKRAPSGAGAPN